VGLERFCGRHDLARANRQCDHRISQSRGQDGRGIKTLASPSNRMQALAQDWGNARRMASHAFEIGIDVSAGLCANDEESDSHQQDGSGPFRLTSNTGRAIIPAGRSRWWPCPTDDRAVGVCGAKHPKNTILTAMCWPVKELGQIVVDREVACFEIRG
jgi:hypothetical protein